MYSGSNDGLIRFWETDDGKSDSFTFMTYMEKLIMLKLVDNLVLLAVLFISSFLIVDIFDPYVPLKSFSSYDLTHK